MYAIRSYYVSESLPLGAWPWECSHSVALRSLPGLPLVDMLVSLDVQVVGLEIEN